jgi:hypothetical protein
MRSGLSKLRIAEHVAKKCLSHERAGIIRVYDRHDYIPEKRDAFEAWAALLSTFVGGNVVTLPVRRA